MITLLNCVNDNIAITVDVETSILELEIKKNILTFNLKKSLMFKEGMSVTALTCNNGFIYLGVFSRTSNSSSLFILSYTDRYIVEESFISLTDRVYRVEDIVCSKTGNILLIQESLNIGDHDTVVSMYMLDKDNGNYELKEELSNADLSHFGVGICMSDDETLLVVLGLHEQDSDTFYAVVLYGYNCKQTMITALHYNESKTDVILKDDTISINGIPMCYIENTELRSVMPEPIKKEPLQVVCDTRKLPDKPTEQHTMIIRHHLLIQQLLNNISIAIKEDRVEKFALKSLELTEERVRITGLEFIPRQED